MAKYCPTAKDDTIEKLEASNVRLRAALVRFVEHFGPLEDNHMLHEDARACFRLARAALGPEQHALAIQAGLTQAR